MRIIAGARRGLQLAAPAGDRVRPTADRARQAVFNILASRAPPLPGGAAVLDVFAGTGAFGLEALSRGAGQAAFIENHPESIAAIQRNLRAFGDPANARLIRADAAQLRAAPQAFDLVFLDPPYRSGLLEPALKGLLTRGWLAPGALLIAEIARDEAPALPAGLAQDDQRDYGAARFLFLHKDEK